ncbi:MAG: hypothetical protein ACK5V0_03790, partial [Alphaproteobacteria bacterium]
VIQHHPHRSGADLRREFVGRLAHKGSIIFGSWSLRQTRGGSKGRKSLSEALLSLFDQTSPKLVYLKKVASFQIFMILAALPSS